MPARRADHLAFRISALDHSGLSDKRGIQCKHPLGFSKTCQAELPLSPKGSPAMEVALAMDSPCSFADSGSETWSLYLVGGLEHFLFSHIWGSSTSQLTFIFFRGVQTTNQILPETEAAAGAQGLAKRARCRTGTAGDAGVW